MVDDKVQKALKRAQLGFHLLRPDGAAKDMVFSIRTYSEKAATHPGSL